MAGKLCFGSEYNNAGAGQLKDSKAFCEGMAYRASDTAILAPKADNPHPAASEAALAWNLGWDFATANVGTVPDTSGTCCAAVPLVPV